MNRTQRFFAKVSATPTATGCLEWQGARVPSGYGSFSARGVSQVGAHRVAWELAHGPIPAGMVVRHSCDNKLCVNVDHLLIGTQKDNIADAVARRRTRSQKVTHCPSGHEYTPENTQLRHRRGGTSRDCRACKRLRRKVA